MKSKLRFAFILAFLLTACHDRADIYQTNLPPLGEGEQRRIDSSLPRPAGSSGAEVYDSEATRVPHIGETRETEEVGGGEIPGGESVEPESSDDPETPRGPDIRIPRWGVPEGVDFAPSDVLSDIGTRETGEGVGGGVPGKSKSPTGSGGGLRATVGGTTALSTSCFPISYTDDRIPVPIVVEVYDDTNCTGRMSRYVMNARRIAPHDGAYSFKVLKGPNYFVGDRARLYGAVDYGEPYQTFVPSADCHNLSGTEIGDEQLDSIGILRSGSLQLVAEECAEAHGTENPARYRARIPLIARVFEHADFGGMRYDVLHSLRNLQSNNYLASLISSAQVFKGPDFDSYEGEQLTVRLLGGVNYVGISEILGPNQAQPSFESGYGCGIFDSECFEGTNDTTLSIKFSYDHDGDQNSPSISLDYNYLNY